MNSANSHDGLKHPIPLTIISGFLGAGKTTLLQYILNANHGKKIAVLVNDFGKINIDAELISEIEGQTISLTNGCICCTIRDDLLTEVLRLLERSEIPEHIIVEASGISDPALIAHTFLLPAMQGVVSVESIISVVDASQLLEMDAQFKPLAQSQIRVADIILINKVDLVSEHTASDVHAYVQNISNKARIVNTIQSIVPLELIMGTGNFDPGLLNERDRNPDLIFQSWTYETKDQFTFIAIRKAMEKIPKQVYRVKGFIHLESVPDSQGIFQMTGGRAWLRLGGYWSAEKRKTKLVFIGKKSQVNPEQIIDLFEECKTRYSRNRLDNSEPIVVKDMKSLSIIFG